MRPVVGSRYTWLFLKRFLVTLGYKLIGVECLKRMASYQMLRNSNRSEGSAGSPGPGVIDGGARQASPHGPDRTDQYNERAVSTLTRVEEAKSRVLVTAITTDSN
jgi:hypothetical protein